MVNQNRSNNNRMRHSQERRQIYTEEKAGPYRENEKYPEPTVCVECGALFVKGRWSWDEIPENVSTATCPACRRTADNYPAGIIELSGEFYQNHREELLNLVQNIKNKEIASHPLERIMEIREDKETDGDKTLVLTTGIHIARRIGDALFNAYEGDLDFTYEEDTFIRVSWKR